MVELEVEAAGSTGLDLEGGAWSNSVSVLNEDDFALFYFLFTTNY